MATVMNDVSDAIDNYTGYSRKVLEYSQIMKQAVDAAKKPGFSNEIWAPLANIVATDEFERVGNFKEVMNWDEYLGFLTQWAASSEWECSFKRISEVGDVVFLELEERSSVGEHSSVVNSVSVYEFNAKGQIRHVDIYLQMEMPTKEMLASYEGIEIGG